jgi:two-component system LytT family response regulator
MSETIKYVIIDDEQACLQDFRWEAKHATFALHELAAFSNPLDAIAFLEKGGFDLLFLDIEMPQMNGFDLLRSINSIDFQVVFTTAYDKYAIDAFKVNAMDYLLKPISSTELHRVLDKYAAQNYTNTANLKVEQFLQKLQGHLSVYDGDGYVFLDFDEIIRLEADSNYTQIITTNKKYLASKSLIEFRKKLPEELFISPHRSHLVNLLHVTKIEYIKSSFLVMDNGDLVRVSKDKSTSIKKLLV